MISALGVTAVYVGSGSSGPFTLVNGAGSPILFENNSELVVHKYTNPDDSHPTLLVLTTDYTLTGAGLDSAGALTLTAPLAAGTTLVIRRQTPVVQTLDLVYGADLSLENLEEVIDKLVRLIQEQREQNERSLIFSPLQVAQASGLTRTFPIPSANTYIGWSADATRLENKGLANTFLSGVGAPAPGLGALGDFYLDTSAMRLYGPKTGGGWGAGTSLIGPAGPQGIQGVAGPPGAPGSGTGDVVGPVSAVDNEVVLFNATTGKIIKNSSVLFSALYRAGSTDVTLADGGTGASLVDPNVDRILFWDDSANSTAFLAPNTGLSITGTNLNWAFLGIEALVDPNADRILFWDDSAGVSTWLVPTNGLEIVTTNMQMTANQRTAALAFIIDGGGATITTGVKGYVQIPFACTITAARLLADQSGSIVVDIYKDTYTNYPPVVGDKITASAPPTITTATKSEDVTLTGWTTAITAGDILGFNVNSVTTHQRVTLMLTLLKT